MPSIKRKIPLFLAILVSYILINFLTSWWYWKKRHLTSNCYCNKIHGFRQAQNLDFCSSTNEPDEIKYLTKTLIIKGGQNPAKLSFLQSRFPISIPNDLARKTCLFIIREIVPEKKWASGLTWMETLTKTEALTALQWP